MWELRWSGLHFLVSPRRVDDPGSDGSAPLPALHASNSVLKNKAEELQAGQSSGPKEGGDRASVEAVVELALTHSGEWVPPPGTAILFPWKGKLTGAERMTHSLIPHGEPSPGPRLGSRDDTIFLLT